MSRVIANGAGGIARLMSISLFIVAVIFSIERVGAQKTETADKTAAEKVADAQKELDVATANLGKAQKAYDAEKEKWFGPPDTNKWGAGFKNFYEKAIAYVKAIETAKTDFNTAVETANDFKAKGDKKGFEGWQEIAKGRAVTVEEKQGEYDRMVEEYLKEIDKQSNTRVVENLKDAESDLERAQKAFNEAEDEAKGIKKTEKPNAPPKEKPQAKKTKAEPKKKPKEKPAAGETGLESEGETQPGKEVSKEDCDGLKEKIRTLQDSLRKLQEDPATPKQDLETTRKQIDELLSRLADCPKQEPIDAQFDCLKSKFPEIQRSSDKKDAASDPTSKREFAWDNDKQAWIDADTKESICPPSGIDPCLVGTWECTSFKQANAGITGGGTGFRVTFKSDGTETVDYSKMQRIRAQDDEMVYEGKATAQISTKDGVAKIEKIIDAGAKFNAIFMAKKYGKDGEMKIPGLGPGGLGTTKGKSNYKCIGDALEYQSSTPRRDADCTVKLTKVKP